MVTFKQLNCYLYFIRRNNAVTLTSTDTQLYRYDYNNVDGCINTIIT